MVWEGEHGGKWTALLYKNKLCLCQVVGAVCVCEAISERDVQI